MKIKDLNKLDYLIGCYDTLIVIDSSSNYTFEAFNVNTGEEITIEGDYLKGGCLDHYDFDNKGNSEAYILSGKMSEKRKEELNNIIREIKDFYYN